MDSFHPVRPARQLGVTQDKIRALCEAGAIDASKTPGGQWRVPVGEIERLQNEGLPPLPHALPKGDGNSSSNNAPRPRGKLLAEPSATLIASRENVEELRHQVEALALRRQLREGQDWFEEREIRAAEEQSAREREEKERRAKLEAERKRTESLKHWERYALRALPRGADSRIKLQVYEAVLARLGKLDPMPARAVVKRLVDAVVAEAIRPWLQCKEKRQAIDRAVDALPWDLRHGSEWQATYRTRAIEAATIAVCKARADRIGREAAALAAVRPIVSEYEHVKQCLAVIGDLVQRLSGSTAEEREDVAKAIGCRLVQMPVGTSATAMKTMGEKLIRPIQEGIAKREEAQQAQRRHEEQAREQTRKLSAAQFRADLALGRVHDALRERERQGKVEFSGLYERLNISEQLRKRIRPILVQELVQKPDLPEAKLRPRIDVLVSQYLREFLDT